MKKDLAHVLGNSKWYSCWNILFFATFLFFSCSKDLKEHNLALPPESLGAAANLTANAAGYCWDDEENGLGFDSILKPTILGARLIGTPYSVAKMQQAALNLTGTNSSISENKWYVRFKPANPDQLAILEDYDIDLFDYPLDYELVQEGDYYDDGVTPAESIPWLYAVVDANFIPPAGITYELLQRLHVPTDYRIENEAFRITGNNVDTAGCTSGMALNATPEANSISSSCDCSIRPSALSCPCRLTCGFSPCLTPLPPVSPSRIPGGKITVTDDVLNSRVPIRNVRLVARRFLKVERTYTDNNGDYKFTKSFRNKFTMLMKFKNNDAIIRGILGVRLWQIHFPVKINMGRYRGNVNNVLYNVEDENSVKTKGAKAWAAATTHNSVQEYIKDRAVAENVGIPPNKLRVWIVQGAKSSGATPMYAKRFASSLPEIFVRQFILPINANNQAYLNSLITMIGARIDMIIGYNYNDVTKSNDRMSEVCYHELTHAAHYNKVGNTWYGNFVQAETNEIVTNYNGFYAPYGRGNTTNSPIIALGESWAYHMGHFLTNRKYGTASGTFIEQGVSYSNSFPEGTLNSNFNLLEDFDPSRTIADPFYWIPQGLYYDLFDNRNDRIFLRVFLDDIVSNYTNQQFFNALDADINNVTLYKARLLTENANSQLGGVNTVFTFYGY